MNSAGIDGMVMLREVQCSAVQRRNGDDDDDEGM